MTVQLRTCLKCGIQFMEYDLSYPRDCLCWWCLEGDKDNMEGSYGAVA